MLDVQPTVLLKAPTPPPRQLTTKEANHLHKHREAILRELRVFLRDATNKLLAEKKFKEFSKPVNPDEVQLYNFISVYC